jgi:hypothetical protein
MNAGGSSSRGRQHFERTNQFRAEDTARQQKEQKKNPENTH